MAPPYDQNLITNVSPVNFADEGSMVTTSSYGVLMPRFTGFTSVLGSLLIIYLILRSPTRLLSPYHRIMFGMSIFDVLTSTAMGLTTLPMPRDDPVVNSYGFQGTRLGNFGTCTAQGFVWVFGIYAANGYNFMLFMYYFFAIGLLLEKRLIQRFVEPLLHIFVLSISLAAAMVLLVAENYNPSIQNPWCTSYPFKAYIDTEEGLKGITLRGNHDKWQKFRSLFGITTILYLSLSIFCLAYITIVVCLRNRKQKHHHPSDTSDEEQQEQEQQQEGESVSEGDSISNHDSNHNNADSNHTDNHNYSETKIILIHSLCYLLVMVLTVIFPTFRAYGRDVVEEKVWIERLIFLFLPLQGFFNFLIFVGSKIAWFRMVQPDLTVVKALNQMFCNPQPDPVVMTSLDIVENDRQKEAERIRMIELREAERIRMIELREAERSDDESSKTPSRANTNDENVEFVTRENIDRYGLRRFAHMVLNNAEDSNDVMTSPNNNLRHIVDAANPTAGNVGDQGLNETGFLKEDERIIRVDSYDTEPIPNNTTSNQNMNTASGNNNNSPPRSDERYDLPKFKIAYPKSSQASDNMSHSLGGFTDMSGDILSTYK